MTLPFTIGTEQGCVQGLTAAPKQLQLLQSETLDLLSHRVRAKKGWRSVLTHRFLERPQTLENSGGGSGIEARTCS